VVLTWVVREEAMLDCFAEFFRSVRGALANKVTLKVLAYVTGPSTRQVHDTLAPACLRRL
jgi:hypothetical protein